MASILIRCTGGTDIPTDALAGWLERQVARIDTEVRVTALRLATVEHIGEFGGYPAGWLVEIDIDDGAHAERSLTEILEDMRVLGLRPAVFMPSTRVAEPAPHAEVGSFATATITNGGA